MFIDFKTTKIVDTPVQPLPAADCPKCFGECYIECSEGDHGWTEPCTHCNGTGNNPAPAHNDTCCCFDCMDVPSDKTRVMV